MKRILHSLLPVILTGFVSVSFSGCGAVVNDIKDEIKEEINEKKAGLTVPEKKRSSIDEAELISEEKAKEIALGKAELTAYDVEFTKVKLDRDDGRYEYEIEFREGYTEYEFEISATDGKIISWDVDRE